MPKSDLTLTRGEYAPVARRVALFYEAHPSGRIVTELVSRTEREVMFRALVFRSPDDRDPAATGWALEREGDGDVNTVACVENTETSAIGRALANLGFQASTERPSLEEMQKATRARARQVGRVAEPSGTTRRYEALQRRADERMDLLRLLDEAQRTGLMADRCERLRARARATSLSAPSHRRLERALRRWLEWVHRGMP